MPVGSTSRVPGVSSGALYRRSAPRTRSPVAVGTLPGRVAVAARAGAADPTPYRTTGRAARPPRAPRRLRVPPPVPSARSASACCRFPLMMFTHVPLLLRPDAVDAVRYAAWSPALSSASLVMAQCRAPAGASNPCCPGPVPRVRSPARPGYLLGPDSVDQRAATQRLAPLVATALVAQSSSNTRPLRSGGTITRTA